MSLHSFPEIIRKAIEAGAADLHVAMLGTIHAYDSSKRRAHIKLSLTRPIDSEEEGVTFETLPILQDVPVLFFGSAAGAVTINLAPGDEVLVHFLDYDPSNYLPTGQAGNPGQTRSHSLGYAVAVPCLAKLSSVLPGAALAALVLEHASSILLGADATDFVALAPLVQAALDTVQATFDLHTHPTPAGASSPPTQLLTSLGPVAAVKVKAK